MIAPSILSADFANLESEIKKIHQAGASWVHVDVMDGHFVPNLTMGAPVVASLKKISPLPLDVHLMIETPEKYVDDFIKAGSDVITIHVESTKNVKSTIEKIKSAGVKAGITFRPKTPIAEIKNYLSIVDLVLVMTVEPGFGGQSFMVDQVEKINDLYQLRKQNQYSYLIEVDGGVNDKTRHYLDKADVLVAGSYVFKADYSHAIQSLK